MVFEVPSKPNHSMFLWYQGKEGLNCSTYFVMEKRAKEASLYPAQPSKGSPSKRGFLFAPAKTSTLHTWHSKTLPHIFSFKHMVSLNEGSRPQMNCMLWHLTWSFWTHISAGKWEVWTRPLVQQGCLTFTDARGSSCNSPGQEAWTCPIVYSQVLQAQFLNSFTNLGRQGLEIIFSQLHIKDETV